MANVDTDGDKKLFKDLEEHIKEIAPGIIETNKLID